MKTFGLFLITAVAVLGRLDDFAVSKLQKVFPINRDVLPRSRARIVEDELDEDLPAADQQHRNSDSLLVPKLHLNIDNEHIQELNPLPENLQQTPTFKSTGTTIVGVLGKDFCILGADSRATAGTLVADKACFKIHELSNDAAAAGAGTAADLEHLTRLVKYSVRLETLDIGNSGDLEGPTFLYICRLLQHQLYQQQGNCQANLIVGGFLKDTPCLRSFHPHGSMDIVDYTSLGSGSLAAMGVLEMEYRTDLSLDKAIALVLKAVSAGIRHDLGSGSQVDICILRKGSSDYRRCALPEESLPNHNINEQLNARKDDDNLIIGVNGFGNIPYTIRSKRVLSASLQTQREETLAVWKDVLP